MPDRPGTLTAALLCLSAVAATRADTATLITHGWQFNSSQFPMWTYDLAEEIAARAGSARVYAYRPATNDWLLATTVGAGSFDHVVLVADWIAECGGSDNPQRGYAEGAADALFSAFLDPRGDLTGFNLADRDIHLIGHSRGAVVNSELAERFAAHGFTVDQLTYLDPHPVNGTFAEPFTINWGDPNPQVWSGVTWADNYYRTDTDPFDFNGMPVPGTHAPAMNDGMFPGANSYAHLDLHLWYLGTVNPTSSTVCEDTLCVSAANMTTWYPMGRGAEGYRYSTIAGGAALRTPAGTSPRVNPSLAPIIYNGGFSDGSMAGWHYHAGGGNAVAAAITGGHALRLDPGQERTHNFFVVPLEPCSIELLAARPSGAGAGNTLVVSLSSPGVPTHTFPPISAALLPASLTVEQVLDVPGNFAGLACTLRIQHVSGGGTGHILIDDVAIFPSGCDTIDFNRDGLFPDTLDIDDFLTVFGGGTCSNAPNCGDIDFNNDGLFPDTLDIDSLISVFGGGPCL